MNRARPDSSAVAKDVDVRGFAYALEPVRQKQQWQLDKTMADLARAQQDVAKVEAQIEELTRLHDEQAGLIGHALVQRVDPAAHRQALNYLAHLRSQSNQLEAQREALRKTCDSLREACMAQQLRIEGLVRHKEDALKDYAHEARRRASAEQDRDWLARPSSARKSGGRAR